MKNYFYDLPEDIQLKIFLHARYMLLTLVHVELWVAVHNHSYDPQFKSAGGIEFMHYCTEVDSDDPFGSESECDGECCTGREANYNKYFFLKSR